MPDMLPAVDRICPLLALGTDRRVVCAAYDPDHRCTAPNGPDALTRLQQAAVCLDPAHRECPHLLAASQSARGGRIPGVPPPSPDVVLAPMRLVIDTDSAWTTLRGRPAALPAARAVAAGVLAVAAVGAVATGAAQRLGGAFTAPDPVAGVPEPYVALPTPSATPSPTPEFTPRATPAPTTSPSSATTPAAATPVSGTPGPSQPAQPQTYVVQEGDTLQAIAERFGTTIAALKAANAIEDEDLIESGQVLTIP